MLYKVTVSNETDEVVLQVSAKTQSMAMSIAGNRISTEMPRFNLRNAEFVCEPVLRIKRVNDGTS